MPTAAKLVALLAYGALAWLVARLTIPYVFEEGQEPGRYAELAAVLGALLGWVMAPRHPSGVPGAVGHGITTTVAIVVAALFAESFAVMLRQSLRRIYDGPMEGLVDVVSLMARNGQALLHQDVLVTLAVGALVAGLAVEWAGRNFR